MRHAVIIIDSDRMAAFELLWRASTPDAPDPVVVDGLIDGIGRHSTLSPAEQPTGGRS